MDLFKWCEGFDWCQECDRIIASRYMAWRVGIYRCLECLGDAVVPAYPDHYPVVRYRTA